MVILPSMKRDQLRAFEARARIAKALAHPTRLFLLDSLLETDRSVGEMTELVGADQSTVSKHLAILREAGFVKVEKDGSTSLYSIRCRCLEGFFSCIENVLKENILNQKHLGS
jgi:ArsR family transcriptional regulator